MQRVEMGSLLIILNFALRVFVDYLTYMHMLTFIINYNMQ